jgi:hypothetical protein
MSCLSELWARVWALCRIYIVCQLRILVLCLQVSGPVDTAPNLNTRPHFRIQWKRMFRGPKRNPTAQASIVSFCRRRAAEDLCGHRKRKRDSIGVKTGRHTRSRDESCLALRSSQKRERLPVAVSGQDVRSSSGPGLCRH